MQVKEEVASKRMQMEVWAFVFTCLATLAVKLGVFVKMATLRIPLHDSLVSSADLGLVASES